MAEIEPFVGDRYSNLKHSAKECAQNMQYKKAIELYTEANELKPSTKLYSQIDKMQAALDSCDSEVIDSGKVLVDEGFYLSAELYNKLYQYQKEGVLWMWKLHKENKGGVLGDDMGLGKTVQVIAFFSGLVEANFAKSALVLLPVSLIKMWEKEIDKWCPGLNVCIYHGGNRKEKDSNLSSVQRRGGILLTSYGTIVNNAALCNKLDGKKFIWDYVILDEGHKIRNPTKTTKAAHEINAKHRLVLTGTPLQNNLRELWSLYDFTHQGTLLGTSHTFKHQYEIPINRSREKDATTNARRLGTAIAKNLRNRIAPFFLRRTKAETILKKSTRGTPNKMSKLTQKNDFIIWLHLSDTQIKIYNDFLNLEHVKQVLMTTRSPLVELTVLKKICDHPRLLSERACIQLGLDGRVSEQYMKDILKDDTTNMVNIDVPDELLIRESGKLQILLELLNNLKAEGHRTLIFSLSRKMLDIIHRILTNKNFKVLRLDGTITNLNEREKRIETFQKNNSYSVFLLTTQVGGVGLTLTAADRVIIFDPSWNPASDSQAVDRAYRIGQQNDVVIYRLITCGTIEEKIYRRQIFKDSITRQATGTEQNIDPHRYFTKSELRELFVLDDPKYSKTQVQLEKMHANQRLSNSDLDLHIKYLISLGIFGISDHDLMFEVKQEILEESEVGLISESYIMERVNMAETLLLRESLRTKDLIEETGIYTRPIVAPSNIFNAFGTKKQHDWKASTKCDCIHCVQNGDIETTEDCIEIIDDDEIESEPLIDRVKALLAIKNEPMIIIEDEPLIANVQIPTTKIQEIIKREPKAKDQPPIAHVQETKIREMIKNEPKPEESPKVTTINNHKRITDFFFPKSKVKNESTLIAATPKVPPRVILEEVIIISDSEEESENPSLHNSCSLSTKSSPSLLDLPSCSKFSPSLLKDVKSIDLKPTTVTIVSLNHPHSTVKDIHFKESPIRWNVERNTDENPLLCSITKDNFNDSELYAFQNDSTQDITLQPEFERKANTGNNDCTKFDIKTNSVKRSLIFSANDFEEVTKKSKMSNDSDIATEKFETSHEDICGQQSQEHFKRNPINSERMIACDSEDEYSNESNDLPDISELMKPNTL